MNQSSFIIFFTDVLPQNVIRFMEELFTTFKLIPDIKTITLELHPFSFVGHISTLSYTF